MSALNTTKCAVMVVLAGGLVVAAGACDDDETTCPSCSTSSSSTTSTSGTGGGGTGGSTGGSGGSTSGTAGGGGIPVAACVGDFAFRAAGMSFGPPTPPDLGAAFNELAFELIVHPITVVLRSTDPQQATLSASATREDQNTYMESFVTGLVPTFTEATVAQGSFWSTSPQTTGYLYLRHDQGVLELELNNVTVHAATGSDCSQATVTLDATVSAAEKSKTLVYSGGSTTVGALAGGDPNDGLQLHALFMTEAVSFDWTTLD